MPISYTQIAGQSLERLAALSDGVFGVAATLLVLDLQVPVLDIVHTAQPLWANGALQSEQVLLNALLPLLPRLVTYFMSFLTLGIFWLGQQTQFNSFTHSNRTFAWIHLIFLFGITLVPFSTGLLADYITFRLALITYWFNLMLLGLMLWISWRYATHNGLLKAEVTPEIARAQVRRIVGFQVLYGIATLLCVVSTALSIALLILLQIYSIFAPRIRFLPQF